MALIWLFPALSTASNLDRSTGPYKWPTWCKKKKKNPSFLSKHQECLSSFLLEGWNNHHYHHPQKALFSTTPPHPHPEVPLPQTFFLRRSLTLGSPCQRPGDSRAANWQRAANCRHRMGFGGTLCTRLPFPSDGTKGKFDFVLSKGSLNLCSLLHANDMRWDPSQLLLKCIRGRHSAERDRPSLCLGEN